VICEIAIFVWMPHLYRAFSLRQILIASLALASVRFTAIGWGADSLLVLLLAQTLHAATFGSFHAAAIGVIHHLFRGRHQARGQAIYGSLAYGLGGSLGSLASGYSWEEFGAAATFTLAAACAFAGMAILWWRLRLEIH
jgi:PPP family 3-phenylpropionic acid transporter